MITENLSAEEMFHRAYIHLYATKEVAHAVFARMDPARRKTFRQMAHEDKERFFKQLKTRYASDISSQSDECSQLRRSRVNSCPNSHSLRLYMN
jgi:hypothetical protein